MKYIKTFESKDSERRYFITTQKDGKKYLNVNLKEEDIENLEFDMERFGAIKIHSDRYGGSYLFPISDALYDRIEDFSKKLEGWRGGSAQTRGSSGPYPGSDLYMYWRYLVESISILGYYDADNFKKITGIQDIGIVESGAMKRLGDLKNEISSKESKKPDYAPILAEIRKIFPRYITKNINLP